MASRKVDQMKIAVTATGPSLDAEVDPRFGRCPYFLIVETKDLSFEAVANANVSLGGGAGIQSAQLMADKAVQYVLTGNCGPNAYRTLEAAGIQVVTGCSGTIRQAVEVFQSGAWSAVQQPNVGSHFGMGMGPGAAATGGQPPGRGMGMGRGMGQGPAPAGPPSAASEKDELTALRQEATDIAKHLRSIEQRIRELENREES